MEKNFQYYLEMAKPMSENQNREIDALFKKQVFKNIKSRNWHTVDYGDKGFCLIDYATPIACIKGNVCVVMKYYPKVGTNHTLKRIKQRAKDEGYTLKEVDEVELPE